jgi:hypothetical protein
MVHQGSWPGARTSHYYFDLNRDWFVLSHPERAAARCHASALVAARGGGPARDGLQLHVLLRAAHGAGQQERAREHSSGGTSSRPPTRRRSTHGWSFFRREGYDEFYPGYGVSWPILTGAVGMTYEQASSAGGAIRGADGTVLTLQEAARHHYTTPSPRRSRRRSGAPERVRDFVTFRRSAVSDLAARPLRTS